MRGLIPDGDIYVDTEFIITVLTGDLIFRRTPLVKQTALHPFAEPVSCRGP